MILDVQRRLELALRELVAADPDIASFAAARIYTFGDQSHRADYPCVLFNLVAYDLSGHFRAGWWNLRIQILGSTYRPDDKDKTTLRRLVGAIAGFCQRTDLVEAVNATVSARTPETALTVRDIRIDDGVPDEDGATGQIYAGVGLAVVCAPHTENPLSPGESDSSASPSESDSFSDPPAHTANQPAPEPGSPGEPL